MLDPKYVPYVTEKMAKTIHGYEYIVLKDNTPKELLDEYMNIINEQDNRIKANKPIMMF